MGGVRVKCPMKQQGAVQPEERPEGHALALKTINRLSHRRRKIPSSQVGGQYDEDHSSQWSTRGWSWLYSVLWGTGHWNSQAGVKG